MPTPPPIVTEDTGTAIVLATEVEIELERLLLLRMSLSNKKAKGLFKRTLRSFEAKIEVAYAFELMDDDLRGDLNAIRDIRNDFAHPGLDLLHFGNPEIVKHMRGFKGWEAEKEDNPGAFFRQKVEDCLQRLRAKWDPFLYAKALKG
jgi:hypothetical protein